MGCEESAAVLKADGPDTGEGAGGGFFLYSLLSIIS